MANFRQISIFPTHEDLVNGTPPSLQPHIINGHYESVEQYLDTQFRLFREDFVCYLREAVQGYANHGTYHGHAFIYENLSPLKVRFADDGLVVILNVSGDSKQMLAGSLIILSANTFQDIFIATIANCLPWQARKGRLLELNIEDSNGARFLKLLSENPSILFTAIQPKAYFEAYRHHLRCLQLLDDDNFPMKPYIVDVPNDVIAPPVYLTAEATYDFSHFAPKINDEHQELRATADEMKDVKVLETNNWPSAENFGIDDSQYFSLKCALTQQMALIQGPPGTGKTYISLRIVETLFRNKAIWDAGGDNTILICCHSNRALDQFMEGVLPFCQQLLRLGGRCRNDIIDPFTIREIRGRTHIPNDLCDQIKKAKSRLFKTKIALIIYHQNKVVDHSIWSKYLYLRSQLKELREQEEEFICRKAKIIGVTTTGAAKRHELIRKLRPRIVVFEEAAQIVDSHVVTALTEHTQHVILIGDHKQLRPFSAVDKMAKSYNLNVSLFERLVRNNFNCPQLKLQYRMPQNISKVLVPLFYDVLENHESVMKRKDVIGVTHNLFFINHSFVEDKVDSTSKSNQFECEFVVALCLYLVNQGYKQSQITVMSMYLAQFFKLKDMLALVKLVDIRVATTDNYQGEENDIIICSFVRSNEKSDIGFLKIPNRVNVALSRAKLALYAFGNFEKMAEVSNDLWKPLVNSLKESGNFGNALELQCQNHPHNRCTVSAAEDFQQFPEGFCTEPCKRMFVCGHVCGKWCHKHEDVESCDHICFQKVCKTHKQRCVRYCHFPEKCDPCSEKVQKRRHCGHNISVSCSKDVDSVPCTEPCGKLATCGHRCSKLCGEICSSLNCEHLVEVGTLCGHPLSVPCKIKLRPAEAFLKLCGTPCETDLKCGHRCTGSCGECFQGRFHKKCQEKCGRILICGHVCKYPCRENCPPCNVVCNNTCNHNSICTHKCGGYCPPCLSRCKWECEHYKCTNLCSEECDRPMCYQKCDKKLTCGHDCIGLCGEPCPKLCRTCNKEEVEDIFFGHEDEPGRKFVELVDCGHIFEFEALTKYMRKTDNEIKLKDCPRCRVLIRRSLLFNTEIQKSLEDIQKVKEKSNVVAEFTDTLHLFVDLKNRVGIAKLRLQHRLGFEVMQKAKKIVDDQFTLLSDFTIVHVRPDLLKADAILTATEVVIDFFNPFHANEEICAAFHSRLLQVLQFVSNDFENYDQQRRDLNRELDLIFHVGKCLRLFFNSLGNNDEFSAMFRKCFKIYCTPGLLSKEAVDELKASLSKAFQLRTKIGIPLKEMKLVLDAMNFKQKGHWFKCPKDHIYCITECGGATEVSKCPECGEAIGGSQHRLLESNAVASEIDSAIMSAYDYAAEE